MAAQSFDAVMASSKNGPRKDHLWVCFSDEISAQYTALEDRLTDAAAREEKRRQPRDPDTVDTSRRLAGDEEPESETLAKEMAALIEANRDAFYEVTVTSLPRVKWRQLRSAHPPRDNQVEDGGLFNSETFPPEAVRACMVDPEPTDEVLAYFEENLTNGDWERLAIRIWALNESGRNLPKAVTDSLSQGG
jgi:hypothetical protein